MMEIANNIGVGIDIEKISRFKTKSLDNDKTFLDKIFTSEELDYCYSKKNFAQHLCARYCAKEAVTKALYSLNITNIPYNQIRITNNTDGHPIVNIIQYPKLNIKLSMSHSSDNAVAYALIINTEN